MINPADWSVREEALDTACSCIVQAPAGSGKTELLIRRFVKLLSLVSDPEEIIAITFTRKAAAEMRNRVTQALADAKGPQPPDRDGRELWEIANRARANDKTRAWNLDRHPSRLRIQTIDSLCAAITRQMPWVSGIGAPPQVVEDALPLYQAAAAATLHMVTSDHKEWGHAVTVLLKHLDIQVPRAIDLLVDMLKFARDLERNFAGIQSRNAGLRRVRRGAAAVPRHRQPNSLLAGCYGVCRGLVERSASMAGAQGTVAEERRALAQDRERQYGVPVRPGLRR